MRVVIGSTSPIKRNSVERGLAALYPNNEFTIECVKTASGVSDQPSSDEETRRGAINRLAHAQELAPGADIYIALEGGVGEHFGETHCFGWVAAESDGKLGFGRTFSFAIPPKISELMQKKES